MGRIKNGVVISGIPLPYPFSPSPPSLSRFCSSSKYMYPYTLHRRSLEIPRRCGWGEGVREILEEKYKVELEFPEWCAMQNKKYFLELHIYTYSCLIS